MQGRSMCEIVGGCVELVVFLLLFMPWPQAELTLAAVPCRD